MSEKVVENNKMSIGTPPYIEKVTAINVSPVTNQKKQSQEQTYIDNQTQYKEGQKKQIDQAQSSAEDNKRQDQSQKINRPKIAEERFIARQEKSRKQNNPISNETFSKKILNNDKNKEYNELLKRKEGFNEKKGPKIKLSPATVSAPKGGKKRTRTRKTKKTRKIKKNKRTTKKTKRSNKNKTRHR
jgi:hypothetical protein